MVSLLFLEIDARVCQVMNRITLQYRCMCFPQPSTHKLMRRTPDYVEAESQISSQLYALIVEKAKNNIYSSLFRPVSGSTYQHSTSKCFIFRAKHVRSEDKRKGDFTTTFPTRSRTNQYPAHVIPKYPLPATLTLSFNSVPSLGTRQAGINRMPSSALNVSNQSIKPPNVTLNKSVRPLSALTCFIKSKNFCEMPAESLKIHFQIPIALLIMAKF